MKRSNGLFSGANWLLTSGSVEFPEISFFRLDSHLGHVFHGESISDMDEIRLPIKDSLFLSKG